MSFPILTSSRLLLRELGAADTADVFRGLSHPAVIPYYGVSYSSLEATQEQMRWYEQLRQEGTGIWWAICAADTGEFCGAVGLSSLSQQHRKAEIGGWLLPEWWGRGLMPEALDLVCRYGFDQLNLHRIEGFVETENDRCRQALRKLAFYHEGTLRECEMKNGRLISLDIYAQLRNEVK
jgi:ribosomal-protein-alanine N-acetyltransferase